MVARLTPRETERAGLPADRGLRRRWLWLGLAGLAALLSACLVVWPAIAQGGVDQVLPVSLQALGMADYSADPRGTAQPPLQMAIVGDVIRDREPGSPDIDVRLTAFTEQLETPVPTPPFAAAVSTDTVTAAASETSVASSPAPTSDEGTVAPTATASATNTSTPGPSPTASPTLHPSISPTVTLTPSNTPTGAPATATMTATTAPPTSTGTLLPTNTQAPSSTPSSTDTAVPPTPTPTATTAPPTPTPPTVSCSDFSLTDFDREGQQATWDLNNDSGSSATITSIYFDWQGDNRELVKIELDGDAIWDEKDPHPPANITGGWKSGVSRTIGAGDSDPLLFQFGLPAPGEGYDLEVGLDNGCTVTN